MKTIKIEYNGYDFQAGYTFTAGYMGDHFNAPEGPFVNVLSIEHEYFKEDFLDTVLFPPEAFIIEQILELETNL